MEGFPFVHRERVRFRDLDAMGHVNNAVFLTYLEQARFRFLEHLGLAQLEQEPPLILARVEIDFRSQATFGDELAVGVRSGRVGTKSFELEFELRVADRLVAEARSVQVAYDYSAGETRELDERWRELLAATQIQAV
ncbi:MAG: acyl-CoA thioesterase [Thermoleophilia bacterium]|nr:acyl-CoA thioesterase [Thermoleophilia bacterium]